MATFQAVQKAIREGSTLEIARENIKMEKEQKEAEERIKKEMRSLGIGF